MKGKQWSFLAIVSIVLFVGAVRMVANSHQRDMRFIKANPNGIAVVELFTSEGCSSCPPADELLSKLKNEADPNVVLLAFHVDYWNYLGWKDRFSNVGYSARQQKYSKVLNCDVYTPQMVVNGETQFVGSDEKAARNAINESLGHAASLSITVAPKYNAIDRSISIAYDVEGKADGEVLNIALVQKAALSNVLKGENSGRKLAHVNVVRDFQTVILNNSTGTVKVTLPDEVTVGDMQVVAYTQLSSNLQVTGAISVSLSTD